MRTYVIRYFEMSTIIIEFSMFFLSFAHSSNVHDEKHLYIKVLDDDIVSDDKVITFQIYND